MRSESLKEFRELKLLHRLSRRASVSFGDSRWTLDGEPRVGTESMSGPLSSRLEVVKSNLIIVKPLEFLSVEGERTVETGEDIRVGV